MARIGSRKRWIRYSEILTEVPVTSTARMMKPYWLHVDRWTSRPFYVTIRAVLVAWEGTSVPSPDDTWGEMSHALEEERDSGLGGERVSSGPRERRYDVRRNSEKGGSGRSRGEVGGSEWG